MLGADALHDINNTKGPRGVPTGALLSVGVVYLLGICLVFLTGAAHAFEVVLSACAVFILFA